MLIGLASPMLHAQPVQSSSSALYLQYGSAEHSTDSWTGGVILPWNWSYALGSGRMTGYWDLSVSRWSADYQGGNRSTWVLGAQPTLRWRPSQGQSPWFLQAGLGLSYAINHRFITDQGIFDPLQLCQPYRHRLPVWRATEKRDQPALRAPVQCRHQAPQSGRELSSAAIRTPLLNFRASAIRIDQAAQRAAFFMVCSSRTTCE